jgi:hypothetical protein
MKNRAYAVEGVGSVSITPEGDFRVGRLVLDDTRTVPARTRFMLPILVERTGEGRERLSWEPEVPQDSPTWYFLFEGVTVDRL